MILLLRRLSHQLFRLPTSFIMIFASFFIGICSWIMLLLEPTTFEHYFNALWYVMTTLTTVGYGDYYPATVPGKIFAMFLYLFGIGLITLVIGKIIDLFIVAKERRMTGKVDYPGQKHIIIIHWNKKAQAAVDELLSYPDGSDIVLIDDIARTPLEHPRIHFVSGDPSSEQTLNQAGITSARSAIVFGDVRIDDAALTDGKSLLIAASIERLAPAVHTTVEIMLEKHIHSFRHANVNDFVLSHDAVSRLAVRSALHEGSTEIYTQLLSRSFGDDLFPVACRPEWTTYRDAFNALLAQGATLVADGGDLSINRKLDEPIGPDPKLFVICDPPTYELLSPPKKGR
ncbi:Ion transport 2 domain-containing protein [Paenibacillus algicola]|uniref:Ion transport 2 domain-containing protein n=1 Tax=Paenibacillus algicola TaxID=2565926 RepID=A0A4P8XPN0_9BACL|nr:potassium channel family protein [Paenibacillus algicola]QCT03621.1 Ion transport 2 domain-containing protein [Paenibacillus algicola]